MQIIHTRQPITIIGFELRTSNERAFEDIPKHWQRFHQLGALGAMPNRLGDDVYAVYTNFEHPGVDNLGVYSLVIGARVSATSEVPAGMAHTVVPAARWAVFPVESGHPERVGSRWRDIWACTEITQSCVCDYERYQPTGEIEIHVGVRWPGPG